MSPNLTPKHCLNISRALTGVKRSDETKNKISQTMMGHPVSPATRIKMRKAYLLRKNQYDRYVLHLKTVHPQESPLLSIHKRYDYCQFCDPTKPDYESILK